MAFLAWIGNIVLAVLLFLWRWFRVLWVCRVSVLSAIGGGLFVIFTPQALDLFADTGLGVRRWVTFFCPAVRLVMGRAYDGAARVAV